MIAYPMRNNRFLSRWAVHGLELRYGVNEGVAVELLIGDGDAVIVSEQTLYHMSHNQESIKRTFLLHRRPLKATQSQLKFWGLP